MLTDLQHQRIAILGAGREGQAAFHWLKTRYPSRSIHLFAESPADPDFQASLGTDDVFRVSSLEDWPLQDYDLLLRSPGISPYRPALQKAIDSGVRVVSPSSLWFAAHPEANTICITGTKGKSTTSSMVAHMLGACGFRVQLAGNIGTPLLACNDVAIDWWVIELSSYQLADLEASPGIGVILNLSPEHLNWHGTVETYYRDKLRLAGLVGTDGKLIINAAEPLLAERFGKLDNTIGFNTPAGMHFHEQQFRTGSERHVLSMPEGLPGRHNRSNVAAALTVVECVGGSIDLAIASLADFQCLPHRLQVLGHKNGVTFINDSISSTPVATSAALEALAGRSLILLLGGLDRGLDWSAYLNDFKAHPPKAIIAIPDNGPGILSVLGGLGLTCPAGMHQAPCLESALTLCHELMEDGDTVLLSPGAPSFPQFRDFRHRGSEFARLAGFRDPEFG